MGFAENEREQEFLKDFVVLGAGAVNGALIQCGPAQPRNGRKAENSIPAVDPDFIATFRARQRAANQTRKGNADRIALRLNFRRRGQNTMLVYNDKSLPSVCSIVVNLAANSARL